MKVFVSSLVSGFESYRHAARRAIESLGHTAIMAEDSPAQPNSPQVACLHGVRDADVVLLCLGARYGVPQPSSGLSPTHEEYREARERKPVLAFVQADVQAEPDQEQFIKEVQSWEGGLFCGSFQTPEDLQHNATRALHEFVLASSAGPVNRDLLVQHATELVAGQSSRGRSWSGDHALMLAVVGGPRQPLLRPVELEAPDLARAIHQQALFGESPIFDQARGAASDLVNNTLRVAQERGAFIELHDDGAILLRLPLQRRRGRHGVVTSMMPVLIEEDVAQLLAGGLEFVDWLLERIDRTHKLTHVAVAVAIPDAGYLAWRTQREHDANPNSVTLPSFAHTGRDAAPVVAERSRAALHLQRAPLLEDLLVLLRRQRR